MLLPMCRPLSSLPMLPPPTTIPPPTAPREVSAFHDMIIASQKFSFQCHGLFCFGEAILKMPSIIRGINLINVCNCAGLFVTTWGARNCTVNNPRGLSSGLSSGEISFSFTISWPGKLYRTYRMSLFLHVDHYWGCAGVAS